jgi:mono/diheme cytochrome c family protein
MGGCSCFVLVVGGAARQTANAPIPALKPVSTTAGQQRAVLNQYCVTCHNERLHTAGLALDKADVNDIGLAAEIWEKVVLKLGSGAMPPPGRPRPGKAVADSLVTWLEGELDQAAAAHPNPGRVAVHRLNRTEYANALRDLLALEIDSKSVLIDEDPGENGFDNAAVALSVSPVLVERYISAARKVSRLAVGDTEIPPVFDRYDVPKMLVQDDRVGEDLSFGTRGGIAIHHNFPVDGEYTLKIRLQGQVYNYRIGLGRAHPLEVRVDGVRVQQFSIGGDAPGRPAPESFAGNIPGDPAWEQYMHDADDRLQVRFAAKAGLRIVSVSFAEFTPEPEGVLQPAQTGLSGIMYNQMYYGNPRIETVSIGGPYQPSGSGDTPSRRKIFVCYPKSTTAEPACANKIISTLARRAYRRPTTKEDIQTLLGFYEAGRKNGGFEAGIEAVLTRILADPEFLVRIEPDPDNLPSGTIYRLSDIALASRLSFFLWSSIPDDELLDLAARDKLHDPQILERQVRRMIADGRSKALTDNFASQWLNLPKLRGAAPDPDIFPEFDENLRNAFEKETELFLESQIREDHSVSDLISANYTFMNERLAKFYQVPKIYGNGFRRVTFSDKARGGLLGQGGILTVTSYANRTSPVIRGKWLLENLLATPPPPPPPNVPSLKEATPGKTTVSVRERLEEHRSNPACAVCHLRMDPLGFSLESFDGIGKWRTTNEDGTPIDVSSSLPDGTRLNGIDGLRKFFLDRRQQFASAVTQKLLAYALGRSVEYFDLPSVRKITREAATNDYRWSSIIEGIVKSAPFQMSVAVNTVADTNNQPVAVSPAANPAAQIRRPQK